MKNTDLYTEKRAAEYLGISKSTLIRRRVCGQIEFYKNGLRILYSKERHLDPYLESCEHKLPPNENNDKDMGLDS
ncbi:MAG TPA: helix-turn-helix domain-containing protein [Pyrinomonadaceae bacterium]|jgi:hypothetical protein